MGPGLRKLALTTHVTCSVGWLGAVAVFFVLALTGLNSEDEQTVRACYVAMGLTGWAAIVPLSLAALLSGLVQSLGTPWGLLRHYWVVVKLLLTLFAALVLLLHMGPISYMARVAVERVISPSELRDVRVQLVVDVGAALGVLLVTTALSVYKPRGHTKYGRRKQREQRDAA